VTPLAAEGTHKVVVEVENVGYLPKNITERALTNQTAVPVRVTAEVEDGELLNGETRLDVGNILGSRDTVGTTGRHESRRVAEYVSTRRALGLGLRLSEKRGTVRRPSTSGSPGGFVYLVGAGRQLGWRRRNGPQKGVFSLKSRAGANEVGSQHPRGLFATSLLVSSYSFYFHILNGLSLRVAPSRVTWHGCCLFSSPTAQDRKE